MEEEEYTPLTCDMCSQTFNRPSDWVRHIEFTHADMTENRRKKRKVFSYAIRFAIDAIISQKFRETWRNVRKRDFRTTWATIARISRLWNAIYAATCILRHRSGYVTYRRSTRRNNWPWWTIRRPLSPRGYTITKNYVTYVKRNSRATPRWSSTRERIRARNLSSVPTAKKAST